jgi:hypothetical protein
VTRITPKIGDWIRPTDPIINQINYGYNIRLIIDIDGDEFTTTCEAFGIEKGCWDKYNTEFVGRVVLNQIYD